MRCEHGTTENPECAPLHRQCGLCSAEPVELYLMPLGMGWVDTMTLPLHACLACFQKVTEFVHDPAKLRALVKIL